MKLTRRLFAATLGLGLMAATVPASHAQDVPAPGTSERIDAIKKRGTLRVGVLATTPWLIEDTSSTSQPWGGPAWMLAEKYAELLQVKVEPVAVSNETKVPVLASDQVDMTISALAKTEQRAKVIDFVIYSTASYCIFGSASNPKLKPNMSLDEFNNGNFSIAFNTGSSEQAWLKIRFPNAPIKGVSSSGLAAPVEEITSGRVDLVPIHRTGWIDLKRKVNGLIVFPPENDCQDSREGALDVGIGIAKDQPEYLQWLNAVTAPMQHQLRDEELRIVRGS